uniref:Integral membrane protein GPR155 n=2 Tax=Cacopsylla melanoneura TaxID=428564 RepID=A0A8D8UIQ9_9HEMI
MRYFGLQKAPPGPLGMNYDEFPIDTEHALDNAVDLDKLYHALVQCFAVILCGYTAGRLGIVSSSEVKGLNTFVGTFALPAVIFTSLVHLDLSSVQWTFIAGVFLAKALVFFAVLGVTYVLPGHLSTARAGLYAIFTTQTNDYALGVPIVQALYDKVHPEFQSYLYLLAPVNLTILNPFGFICLELHKARSTGNGAPESNWFIGLKVLRNIITNPIVFMSMLGMVCNFAFNHEPPVLLFKILEVFSEAFPATALFLLGLRMVGKVQTLHGSALLVPGVLIGVKLVVVPLVLRQVVYNLLTVFPEHAASNGTTSVEAYSTFAFLYGTVPSAPGVFVYATSYNLDVELIASAMVACTFLSAPIMFISARLISLASIPKEDYQQVLDKFNTDICLVSLFACVWLVTSFLCQKNSRSRQVLNGLVNLLVVSRIAAILVYLTEQYLGRPHDPHNWVERLFNVFGDFSTLVIIPCLALAVFLTVCHNFTLLLYLRPYFYMLYLGIPLFYYLVSQMIFQTSNHTNDNMDPYELILQNLALFLALFVTIVCLVLTQRHSKALSHNPMVMDNGPTDRDYRDTAALAPNMVFNDVNNSDLTSASQQSVDMVNEPEDGTDNEESVMQHVILLILLCISMFISLSCGLWYAEYLELSNGGNILVEMFFVENALRLGMPLLIFCVFAFDTKNFLSPAINRLIEMCSSEDRIQLVPWDQLSFETRHVCDQFIGYHLKKCRQDIAKDIRWKLLLYKQSFTGDQLVSWLLSHDIASDRVRALEYAQHLVQGRVLRHIQGTYAFQDSPHKLYTFVPSANSTRR